MKGSPNSTVLLKISSTSSLPLLPCRSPIDARREYQDTRARNTYGKEGSFKKRESGLGPRSNKVHFQSCTKSLGPRQSSKRLLLCSAKLLVEPSPTPGSFPSQRRRKRRLAASLHSENTDLFSNPDEEENFVDARETPLAVSPKLSRGSSMKSKHMGEKELMNKVEELGIENKSLKDCIDKLAKRLQAFEMSAQQSSMALQESMRFGARYESSERKRAQEPCS